MIELRTVLNVYLKSIYPNVYHSESVPETATFPYLVYDLPNVIDDGESMETVVVDIDGWDIDKDTTALETLMAEVNYGLSKRTLATGNIAVTFYLDTKLSLRDDDPQIRRRKYTYQAKLFRKG
ncbi:DUF3168 domain-containing protein [Desulfosporosinus sp. OT]|uniref:tail completion protein gp17 n=1 Tax=Desulfosporosinus sp. OT TaxID=913865 RepID=UPI00059150EC|nr:DUF3168 domain-containing protein [Desulfosporosinus sp. OT]